MALPGWDVGVATLDVSYSEVQGGQAGVAVSEAAGTLNWGEGNIDRDPDLTGDYRLGPRSFCIDAGTDAGVAVDIDGDPRPHGGGFDMGADEFTGEPEVALLSPDMWEVLETAPSFLWSPGGCEAYLFLGYVPYTWQGGVVYRPVSFWMTEPGFTMPPEWWDAVAPVTPFIWGVIGYDEDGGLYRWSSTAAFTKASAPPASTILKKASQPGVP